MRKLIIHVLMILFISLNGYTVCHAQNNVDVLIRKAKSYLGVNYQWGGTSYSGIDCSGLMQMSFRSIGVYLPRVSRQQANFKHGIDVPIYASQASDLIFFSSNGRYIDHVGLIYQVVEGKVYFIHASSSRGGVVLDTLEGKWRNIYVKCVRVLHQ